MIFMLKKKGKNGDWLTGTVVVVKVSACSFKFPKNFALNVLVVFFSV